MPIPGPAREEEIRLAHELAVLRDELAEGRGEDETERIEGARLAHLLGRRRTTTTRAGSA